MFFRKISVAALSACGCAIALAAEPLDDAVRIDRYTVSKLTPRPEQIDLLSTLVQTQFPSSVSTLGDAIDYILKRSGYRRIADKSSAAQMDFPLPAVHRQLGPINIRAGISTLAGPTLTLHEDASSRTIWLAGAPAPDPSTSTPDQPTPAPNTDPSPTYDEPAALPEPPAPATATGHTISVGDWELTPTATLRENLESWAQLAGWQLTWRSKHDYQIEHRAVFRSMTFESAVAETLEFYRTAPIPLSATYYEGNAVIVIAPTLSTVTQ